MTTVERFTTDAGRTIYRFPVPAFANLVAQIHVVDDGERLTLVDAGSGLPESNAGLLDGFAAIREAHDPRVRLESLDAILLTHGHIDHFGGLPFVRERSAAPAGIHILDRRVVSNHEERMVVAARRLETFLGSAGVPAARRAELMRVYLWAKGFYRSTPVEFCIEETAPVPGDFVAIHTPGHCPGQVCLRVDDILLTADHVLARITPHQAPESITNHMGLGHYLRSLERIAAEKGVRLALGGHEAPIPDLAGRVGEIRRAHDERLARILEICAQPRSTAEISLALFGRVESYHVLLALEETGAHVEYLYQRGELVAANLEEIGRDVEPVIRYARS